jgi:hypothetical protein
MKKAVAVGQDNSNNCLVAQFDPDTELWSVDSSLPTINGRLWGVWAYSPEDIWVCGGTGNAGITAPILYHWNGDEWEDHSSDITDATYFTNLWGDASDNIYLNGKATGTPASGAWVWDGDSWTSSRVNGSTNIGYMYRLNGSSKISDDGKYCYSIYGGSPSHGNGVLTGYRCVLDDGNFSFIGNGNAIQYYSIGDEEWKWTEHPVGGAYTNLMVGSVASCVYVEAVNGGGAVFKRNRVAISSGAATSSSIGTGSDGVMGNIAWLDSNDIWICYEKWGVGQWASVAQLTHYEGGTTWSDATDYGVNGLDALCWCSVAGYEVENVGRSTTTDLSGSGGTYDGNVSLAHRNVFLKINGLEPILWRYSNKGEPTDWSRSIKTCLEVTAEIGMGLNIAEAKLDASGITFELDDVLDTDGTYYFGKLFAPARWANNPHARVASNIEPDEDQIFLLDASSLPASGTAYLGDETITYTSKNDTNPANTQYIDGVTRDVYPCVDGASLGKYYELPLASTGGYRMAISTVPFTWVGRKVALYVITWNQDYQAWNAETDAKCVFLGRISDRIQYDGARGKWLLSCESIMKELDRKIADKTRKTTLSRRINMCSTYEDARTIRVKELSPGGEMTRYHDLIVSARSWKKQDLIQELWNQAYNSDITGWDWVPLGGYTYGLKVRFELDETLTKMVIKCTATSECKCRIEFGPNNHMMQALGFKVAGGMQALLIEVNTYSTDDGVYYETYTGDDKIYTCYHPVRQDFNGAKLFTDDTSELISDQGDRPDGETGTVRIRDYKTLSGDKRTAFYRFNQKVNIESVSYDAGQYIQLAFDYSYLFAEWLDFIGATDADSPPEVEQVFSPWPKNADLSARGPFEQLLRIMLSSGAPGTNHATYDVFKARDYCLGIPATLVDVDSFLNADKMINVGEGLARRDLYPIENKSFFDLAQAECKLFGFSLVWRNNQFAIIETMPPPVDTYQATIDKDVIGNTKWVPKIDYSTEVVVNQYECQINFNYLSNKFDPPTTVTDMDSVSSLAQIRSIKLEHKGIFHWPTAPVSVGTITEKLLGRLIRFPMPVFEVPLMPTLINTIFVGDVVVVDLDNFHDPFGGGTKDLTAYGVILNLTWNFNSWLGQAKIMLFALCDAFGPPYSGAAVTDVSATNGGWDAGTYQLTLLPHEFGESSTDDEDGERFEAGHFIKIVERAPADPENAQTWGPIEVAKNYAADGDYILTLDTTTLTGWDSTKEYVVMFADYSDVVTAQQSASYIGDIAGYAISTDVISRWG